MTMEWDYELLPDQTIEQKVICEEGDENALLLSVSYEKTLTRFVAFCKKYHIIWSLGRPDRLIVRRSRTDMKPVIDMGLNCLVRTELGEDSPDPETWQVLYPRPDMYRNGPYFFHQMEQADIHIAASGRMGGRFLISVVCARDELEYRAVYYPPEKWRDAKLTEAVFLLDAEGKGSKVDADGLFAPICFYHGAHWQPIDEPAIPPHTFGFMTPPFCYPLHRTGRDEWFSVSAEPENGQLCFTQFNTQPGEQGRLAVTFDYGTPVPLGQAAVLPPVVVRFGAGSPFEALEKHADALVRKGRTQRPVRHEADWWRSPIACGWREQTLLMLKDGAPKGYPYCTQAVYERLVQRLEELDIPFGTLVIDAIWSIQEERWELDREKWPDMRGFIEKQHQKGRHVLLWVCPNAGTLPDDELYITEESRLVDPLNPAYRARIERSLEVMLGSGEGCLNADGLKLDYTGGMPSGGIVKCTKPLYGYEYLCAQYRLYHDMAKKAKPDCLLEFQVSNPYMAAEFDMVRLNDYLIAPGMGMAQDMMADRMRIAQSVNYGTLVDVDGIRSPEYISHSDEIGVPAIYLGLDDFDRCPDYAKAAGNVFKRQGAEGKKA